MSLPPAPSTPPAYVAGSVTLPANAVKGLLELIQSQLDPNCPGGPRELQLAVGSGGNVYVGAYSRIAGPLSSTNWAYSLGAGEARVYRSTYPGSNVPLGNLEVLADSAAVLHVEVQG